MIETSKLTFGTLQGTGFKSVNGNEIPQFIDKLVDSEHPNDKLGIQNLGDIQSCQKLP